LHTHLKAQIFLETSKQFEISDEGEVDKYLGVSIEKRDYCTMKISQPFQTKHILKKMDSITDKVRKHL